MLCHFEILESVRLYNVFADKSSIYPEDRLCVCVYVGGT